MEWSNSMALIPQLPFSTFGSIWPSMSADGNTLASSALCKVRSGGLLLDDPIKLGPLNLQLVSVLLGAPPPRLGPECWTLHPCPLFQPQQFLFPFWTGPFSIFIPLMGWRPKSFVMSERALPVYVSFPLQSFLVRASPLAASGGIGQTSPMKSSLDVVSLIFAVSIFPFFVLLCSTISCRLSGHIIGEWIFPYKSVLNFWRSVTNLCFQIFLH